MPIAITIRRPPIEPGAEVESDSDPDAVVIAPAVITGPIVAVRPRVCRRRAEVIGVGVVHKRTADSHSLGNLCQRTFGLARDLVLVEDAVVPVIPPAEVTVAERILRERDIYGPVSNLFHGPNGVVVLPIAYLEVATAANEVVRKGVEREEHADAAFRIGMKHHEMSVCFRADVHPDLFIEFELVVVTEPNLQRWILLDDRRCGDGHGRDQQREKSDGLHGTSTS